MTASPYAHRPWLRHYDYWVSPHMVYPERPLHEILDTAVIDVPNRPATSFLGATLTFQEIKDRSDRLASLARMGIARVRVGIMLPNCPQPSAFAILRLGTIVVNINPSYRRARFTVAVTPASAADHTRRFAPLVLAKDKTAIEQIIVTSLADSAQAAAPPRVAVR